MQDVQEPLIYKLLDYLALLDAGCPVGRHELTDIQWQAMGVLKAAREIISAEKAKKSQSSSP